MKSLLPFAAVALVWAAFTSCAVAEVVTRVAARLYSANPMTLAGRREEWLAEVQAMRPLERPLHAGSLLWAGVSISVPRWLTSGGRQRHGDELVQSFVARTVGDLINWMDANRGAFRAVALDFSATDARVALLVADGAPRRSYALHVPCRSELLRSAFRNTPPTPVWLLIDDNAGPPFSEVWIATKESGPQH